MAAAMRPIPPILPPRPRPRPRPPTLLWLASTGLAAGRRDAAAAAAVVAVVLGFFLFG